MRIHLFCFWNALGGYGRAARDYVAALTAAGQEVQVVDWTSIPGATAARATSPEPRYQHLDRLVQPWPQSVAYPDLAIYHGPPRLLARLVETNALPSDRLASIALTTWETSDFPRTWRKPIEEGFLSTLVPSQWCADIMAMLDHEVRVVPHTFDPAFWDPTPPPPVDDMGGLLKRPPLQFYALGAWSERKNHEATLRAYLHAFTPEDNVSLTIRSQDVDYGAVRSLLARTGLAASELPELTVSHQPMSEDELVDFHRRGDVFVSSSRGEAWGLPAFEAAVMGKAIIGPDCSGERSYLAEGARRYEGFLSVGSSLVPCFAGPGIPIVKGDQIVGEKSSRVAGMTCRQLWAEPSVRDMAALMHACYAQHEGGHPFTGMANRADLVQRFGYDAVARTFMTTLEEIIP